ncbi:hemerythrin domain-containing protein [Microbacterium sp. 4R-513]|uniref:hemerythrin domain-containing protein n=1 Tax=Microbacterium sp. 4R-513 TaxID=2567934 RepID=UPI0013E1AEA5|nr:hemerythrin domain-containing protein [Microbacterium sp. 4R-513]QIG38624.1 hemerythrin domain-containing protein [Microbacterium sp. 4R-513]
MPATPLPPSGDVPKAKTCDASGMAEIHRMYKAGFGEAPRLVRGVAQGDTAHAEVVAGQLDLLSAALHAHHEGEDERLWAPLAERAPACAVHVERMKQHHAELLVHLNAMDAALPAWRRSAGTMDAAPLLAALDGVNGALAVHLPDEETNIVPVMETVITQPEVEWFSEHGRKATPKGQTWNSLGLILESQPDGGDQWMRKNLPGPVRLLWRWVGKPKYAKHRAALEGR